MLLQMNQVLLNQVNCPQTEGGQVMDTWSYCVLQLRWLEVKSAILQARFLRGSHIIHLNYWMKCRKGLDGVREIDAYALVCTLQGRVTQGKMGRACGRLVGGRISATGGG